MNDESARPGALPNQTQSHHRQVAGLIGASERTVRRLAQEGVLDRVRIGCRTSRYTSRSVLVLVDPHNEQRPGEAWIEAADAETAEAPEQARDLAARALELAVRAFGEPERADPLERAA